MFRVRDIQLLAGQDLGQKVAAGNIFGLQMMVHYPQHLYTSRNKIVFLLIFLSVSELTGRGHTRS